MIFKSRGLIDITCVFLTLATGSSSLERPIFPPHIFRSLVEGLGFPGGSDGKESACNAGDLDSIPGLGRSPGRGYGNPLQYSCLENPQGQRSLAGYSVSDRKESGRTELLSIHKPKDTKLLVCRLCKVFPGPLPVYSSFSFSEGTLFLVLFPSTAIFHIFPGHQSNIQRVQEGWEEWR